MKNIIFGILAIFLVSGCTKQSEQTINVKAVVIGMEHSKWAGKCPGAHIDATRMYKEFLPRSSNVTLLEDSKATKHAVISALNDASDADLTILFYSGHGGSKAFSNTGPEEIDGHDEYLCLYDTYLKDNEIWEFVTKCKGKIWLIFDCCHSETMFRSVGFRMKMIDGAALSLSEGTDMLCWSGCADDTYSYGDDAGGVFTTAIFRHLRSDITYDDLWKRLVRDETLKSYEIVKQTKIGTKFNGKEVFH